MFNLKQPHPKDNQDVGGGGEFVRSLVAAIPSLRGVQLVQEASIRRRVVDAGV